MLSAAQSAARVSGNRGVNKNTSTYKAFASVTIFSLT